MNFCEVENEVKNCQTLDELFSLWKQAHALEENYEKTTVTETFNGRNGAFGGIDKNSFIADGYIDEKSYKKADVKILFILKEANVQAYRGEEDLKNPSRASQVDFYANYVKDGSGLNRPKQQEKLGRVANYILTHKDEKDETSVRGALRQCAFMNVNKRGGGNADRKVNAYIRRYKTFIKKQIEILNPDICVIIGKTMNSGLILPPGVLSIKLHHTADRFHGIYAVDKYVEQAIKEISNMLA